MKSVFASLPALLVGGLLIAACSSASGPSLDPDESDCKSVCSKYHDCVSQSSDETKCVNDCTAKAKSDNVYEAHVKDCAACVEPRECSQTGTCIDDCLATIFK